MSMVMIHDYIEAYNTISIVNLYSKSEDFNTY